MWHPPLHSQTDVRKNNNKLFIKLLLLPPSIRFKGHKRGMYRFFVVCFGFQVPLHKSTCHMISQSLFVSFISILFLSYNKVCSTTAQKDRTSQFFVDFFLFVCQFTRRIFLLLDVNLDDFLPHTEWSHMHVLKPEAINITKKKIYRMYLQTFKIFIYIYLYIYKIHSVRMGRHLCTNEAPITNEQTNERRRKQGKSQIRWSPGQLEWLQLSGSPLNFR